MSLKKLIPIILILGIILASPMPAQARHDQDRSSMTIDEVVVSDFNGDGYKDAEILGTLTLVSEEPLEGQRVVLMYFLTYLPDGTYNGPYNAGRNWVFSKTYTGMSSSPDGADNAFVYNIDSLPYPGWYKIHVATMYKGERVVSNAFEFDPPGGGPGPIGR